MYSVLLTEHETKCKSIIEDHAKCAELAMTMTAERDAAVKAHAECGAGAEGLKKQLEEKDAALKAANEKVTGLETERDALKKQVEGGGASAEASKKALDEKDAEVKAAGVKVAALEAERDELKKKTEGGGAEMKAANEKIAALEAERDELKKRADAGGDPEGLKKQIEAKDAEIKSA
jgi:chromosome segregation ATPase